MNKKDELHQALAAGMLAVTSDQAKLIAMPSTHFGVATSACTSGMWALELDRLDLAERALAVLHAVAAEYAASPEVVREQRRSPRRSRNSGQQLDRHASPGASSWRHAHSTVGSTPTEPV